MAARNWIYDKVTEALEMDLTLKNETMGFISNQIHDALVRHQETRNIGVDGPFNVSSDSKC